MREIVLKDAIFVNKATLEDFSLLFVRFGDTLKCKHKLHNLKGC